MLKEKIQTDLKNAMIGKNDTTVSVLRMLLASLLNKEKEKQYKLSKEGGEAKKPELTDEEVTDAVSSEIKKLRDAIVLFEKGGRADLAEKNKAEIAILSGYLPEQLSEDEIRALVKETVAQTGASGIKEMGKVMAVLMPKTRGKADSGIVSKIVKESLGQ